MHTNPHHTPIIQRALISGFLFLLSFFIHFMPHRNRNRSECCCRNNKDPLVPTLDNANISTIAGNGHTYLGNPMETTLPPNYDELDPPPSYSVLFPGNKFESVTTIGTVTSAATTTTSSSSSSSSASQSTIMTSDASLPGSSITTTSLSSLQSSNDDFRSIPLGSTGSILPN